jgi:extracellular factor (EF) 3-hydroxypalmitic acid methyl ester biosynthesis protein
MSAILQAHPTGAATVPAAQPVGALRESLNELLHRALACIEANDARAAYRLLTAPLSALWSEARGSGLGNDMRAWCQAHPLYSLLLADPFTERARRKPRGYAGDAVMMDFIYRAEPPADCDAAGAALFAASTRSSMSLSVCYRRDLLRGLIDETVALVPKARMLSVACGHARELRHSAALAPDFDGEFVALDQDARSCAEIERSHLGPKVRVVRGGVRQLLVARSGVSESLGHFDFIYSAGLYDYLDDTTALRLSRQLLRMLRPGGRLLLANFLPNGSARAYMELFMDWPLVLRSEQDMEDHAQALGATTTGLSVDPYRNVVYLTLQAPA